MKTLSAKDFETKYGVSADTIPGPYDKKEAPAEKGFFGRVGDDLSKRFSNVKDSIKVASDKGLGTGTEPVESTKAQVQAGFNIAGQGAGAILDVIGEGIKTVIPGAVEKGLGDLSNKIAEVVTQNPRVLAGLQAINSGVDKYTEWKLANPEDAKSLEGAVNIAQLLVPGKANKIGSETGVIEKKVVGLLKSGEDKFNRVVPDFEGVTGKEFQQKLVDFVAPEADDATKTILKESTPEDIDKFVTIQEAASRDPRAVTPYETIGDTMAKATKELTDQMKVIGEKKREIIKPLAYGLDKFDASSFIDDLTSLKNSKSTLETGSKATIDKIITAAKDVKTKGAADKFVDDIQDMIYSGNKQMTIPQGSALDRQLRGALGKLNNALKDSLPKEYRALNTKYSNLIKATGKLNRSLGEVVDGISTRGGSLVKQFFSPNGRAAKQLFEYIKANTGIDLAKDATLAKYIMELYQDPRVNTLLGGNIPTSKSGILSKGLDLVVEKTGLGKKIQEKGREAAIRNAKKITQKK
jgi:hypothetical protein